LLVFVHLFAPEAGKQVQAGTVKGNEHHDEAVLREAFEETGLSDLILDYFLDEHERDMSDFGKDEIHLLPGDMKNVTLPTTEKPIPILFEFFWHHCQKVSQL
jgi:8-oxo-dGTP pyrophosphatase MutT (NUDIX family)